MGSVKVNIGGKERTLRLTMRGIIRFKEITGKDIFSGKLNDTADSMAILWACLIHEDKELTLESLEEMIGIEDVTAISAALNEYIQSWETISHPFVPATGV